MRRSLWIVLVSATSFATPAKDKPGKGCPGGMVRVPTGEDSGFCIDKTEVTVAAYSKCVAAGHCERAPLTVNASWIGDDEARLWSQFCNGDRADRANHPINCVDWNAASAYCRWIGARLPSDAEWDRAARGDDGRTYPWGNAEPSPKLLNACGGECVALSNRIGGPGLTALYAGDDGAPATAPVGSYPAGASPYGVLDLMGNVEEWVEDHHGSHHADRGGGWLTTDTTELRVLDTRDTPDLRLNALGFRCARSL